MARNLVASTLFDRGLRGNVAGFGRSPTTLPDATMYDYLCFMI